MSAVERHVKHLFCCLVGRHAPVLWGCGRSLCVRCPNCGWRSTGLELR